MDGIARRFDENRAHLRAVAYRMLGSTSEADDAVQEAWLRLSRADSGDVANLSGWLTTVVARVCLDMLRSRESRREEPLDGLTGDAHPRDDEHPDAERDLLLADVVGPALLVVLETLAPAERLAFVLHDLFAVPFDDVAPIVGRTVEATRQLASRARRRVRGAAVPDADHARQRRIVGAFFAASRSGDFDALLALLDPGVVLRADAAAVLMGATGEVSGADAVARTFSGRARGARLALVDGAVAAVWAPGGTPCVLFSIAVADGRIVAIDMVAEADRLAALELEYLDE